MLATMVMLRHPARGFCPLCGQLVPGWDRAVTRARAVLFAAMSDDPTVPEPDAPVDPLDPDAPDDDTADADD